MALEINQQYNVHEKVGNALFTGIAAAMKAGIAYKDSPSYVSLTNYLQETCRKVCSYKKEKKRTLANVLILNLKQKNKEIYLPSRFKSSKLIPKVEDQSPKVLLKKKF